MLALGSVKSIITDSVKNGRIHFDMHGFLTNVVLADLNLSGMWDPESLGRTAGYQRLGVSDESVRLMCACRIWKCTCASCSCEKKKSCQFPRAPSSIVSPLYVGLCFQLDLIVGCSDVLCLFMGKSPAVLNCLQNSCCTISSHLLSAEADSSCSTWIQIMLLAKWDSVIGNSAGFCSLCYLTSVFKKVRGSVENQTSKGLAN